MKKTVNDKFSFSDKNLMEKGQEPSSSKIGNGMPQKLLVQGKPSAKIIKDLVSLAGEASKKYFTDVSIL